MPAPVTTVNPSDPTQQQGGKPSRSDDLTTIILDLQKRIAALENNLSGENSVPVGIFSSYAGSQDPIDPDGVTRWLICNGRAINRGSYSALFNQIGTTYGNGNGSTTFNIPDMRGRFALGMPTNSSPSLGQSGGQLGHTHTVPSLSVPSLSIPALSVPGHYHGAGNLSTNSSGNHAHNTLPFPSSSGIGAFSVGAAAGGPYPVIAMSSGDSPYFVVASGTQPAGAHTHGLSGSVGNVASGNSGDNPLSTNASSTGSGSTSGGNTGTGDPPYLVVTYIIKVI